MFICLNAVNATLNAALSYGYISVFAPNAFEPESSAVSSNGRVGAGEQPPRARPRQSLRRHLPIRAAQRTSHAQITAIIAALGFLLRQADAGRCRSGGRHAVKSDDSPPRARRSRRRRRRVIIDEMTTRQKEDQEEGRRADHHRRHRRRQEEEEGAELTIITRRPRRQEEDELHRDRR